MVRRWIALVFLFACDNEDLIIRGPPWAPDAQVALLVLDENGLPQGEPRLFFAQAKIEVRFGSDVPVEIVAFEYPPAAQGPDGSPLVDCGAVYSGGNRQMPAPLHRFRSGVIDFDELDRFRLVTASAPMIPLFHQRCANPCADFEVVTVALPFGDPMWAVAPIGGDDAYIVGEVTGTAPSPFLSILKVINLVPSVVRRSDSMRGIASRVASDGQGAFYGSVDEVAPEIGHVFAFDRDGTPLPIPALDLGNKRKRLAIGRDGALFAGGSTGLFELTRGSTIAERIDEIEAAIAGVGLSRSDRVFALDVTPAIYGFNGTSWAPEWTGVPTVRIHDISVDEDQALVVGDFGLILRRDDPSHTWVQLPVPPGREEGAINAVTSLRNGRFAVSFETGGIGLWNGTAWCDLQEQANNGRISTMASDPEGTRAFGVANSPTGAELRIIRVLAP